MKTLIFLCMISALALTFASPVPEEEEKEVDKRFILDTFKDIGHWFEKGFKTIKNGVKQFSHNVARGGKEFGYLLTKTGRSFGLLVIKDGKALLKAGDQVFQLNDQVYHTAKKQFEAVIRNGNFEQVLVKVFPALDTSAANCQQVASQILAAEGFGAVAVVGSEPIKAVCTLRAHVIDSLKDSV